MSNRLLLSLAVPVAALMAVCLYLRYKQQQKTQQSRDKVEAELIAGTSRKQRVEVQEESIECCRVQQETSESSDMGAESAFTSIMTDSTSTVTNQNSSSSVDTTEKISVVSAVNSVDSPSQNTTEQLNEDLKRPELRTNDTLTAFSVESRLSPVEEQLSPDKHVESTKERRLKEDMDGSPSKRKENTHSQTVNGHHSGSDRLISATLEKTDTTNRKTTPDTSISETYETSVESVVSQVASSQQIAAAVSEKLVVTEKSVQHESVEVGNNLDGHVSMSNGLDPLRLQNGQSEEGGVDKADNHTDGQPDNASERSTDSGKGGSSSSYDHCAASPPPPSPEYPVSTTTKANNIGGDLDCVVGDGVEEVNSTAVDAAGLRGGDSIGTGAYSPDMADITLYEFLMPERYCGRLIGRGGSFVNMLHSRTGVNVTLLPIPFRSNFKSCQIEGRPDQIKACLALIREKFPESKFPSVILEPASALPVAIPHSQQLHLPPGVTTSVIVSSVVTPGHLFVQQHAHPTYCSLVSLSADLNKWYGGAIPGEGGDAPHLPQSLKVGDVLVARAGNAGWFRAVCVGPPQVLQPEGAPTTTTTTTNKTTADGDCAESVPLRFVDYGGYMSVVASDCRQMHYNFMSLPFQAAECYLANIVPATDEGWTPQSFQVLEELIAERALEALVVNAAPDGVPCINLYVVSTTQFGNSVASLVNQMLVDRGVARWMDHASM